MLSKERYENGKQLLKDLLELYNEVLKEGDEKYCKYEPNIIKKDFKESAKNFLYYLALRTKEIQSIQTRLIPWGLSSLGRLEGKTLVTLQAVIYSLSSILNIEVDIKEPKIESFYKGDIILDKNTLHTLGNEPKDYRTRIMVTLPTEAANDKSLIRDLIKNDMNIARINCSHDNIETWDKMISLLRSEAKKQSKEIKILMDIPGPKIRTDWIYTTVENPKLEVSSKFKLVKNRENINFNEDLKLQTGILMPEIFKNLKVGDPILFDDGVIVSKVISIDDNGAILEVEKIKGTSKRLKSKKGINLPLTKLEVNILSDKDKKTLEYAAHNADIIGCSFIRSKNDIIDIQNELSRILGNKADDICLMAKIETVSGVENLPEIILQANSKNPFCVMIARGDLAVESGYSRLGELQQEIMWICEAANVPVIWATEVLGLLVNSGVPTRAEITDATVGANAECIMLNKGDYIIEAIDMLKDIFIKMQKHQYKKTYLLRALNIAELD